MDSESEKSLLMGSDASEGQMQSEIACVVYEEMVVNIQAVQRTESRQ